MKYLICLVLIFISIISYGIEVKDDEGLSYYINPNQVVYIEFVDKGCRIQFVHGGRYLSNITIESCSKLIDKIGR